MTTPTEIDVLVDRLRKLINHVSDEVAEMTAPASAVHTAEGKALRRDKLKLEMECLCEVAKQLSDTAKALVRVSRMARLMRDYQRAHPN
jgi:hypothetical protein